MAHTVLCDLNNFGFSGMSAAKLSVGGKDTQSIFYVLRRAHSLVSKYPHSNIIFLDDGRSWRRDIYSEYKANRTKTEKQEKDRQDYFEQKKEIKKALELLGLRQVWATNQEADDMAAMLSKKLGEKGEFVTLLTADCDWQQLVTPNVEWRDLVHDKFCNHKNFQSITGYEDSKQFIEAKCILGDPSDNIKGINGVGPKALEGIYKLYDDFEAFLCHLGVDRLHAQKEWQLRHGKIMPKALRELDTEAARNKLEDNLKLVDLHTDAKPKIDKIIDNRGKLNKAEFENFCYRNAFLSITRNTDEFIKPFKENKYVYK